MLGRNLRVTLELSLLLSLNTFYVSAKCTSVPAEKVLGMQNVQSLEMLQFAVERIYHMRLKCKSRESEAVEIMEGPAWLQGNGIGPQTAMGEVTTGVTTFHWLRGSENIRVLRDNFHLHSPNTI